MPAGGDNKPKTDSSSSSSSTPKQSFIGEARAISSDEKYSNTEIILSVLAVIAAIASFVILALAAIHSYGGGSVDTGNILFTAGVLIVSIAYLTRQYRK